MKKTGLSSKIVRALQGSSSGLTLVEVLIAIALIGILAIAFLGGLSNALMALHFADVRTSAESLARSEMEYVKSQGFYETSWSYVATESSGTCTSGDDWCPPWFIEDHGHGYAGYTVKVQAEPLDNESDNGDSDDGESGDGELEGIKKITVTVSYHERGEVITLVGYKAMR